MKAEQLNTLLVRILLWAVIGAAVLYVAAYVFIAGSRIDYAFELEWMEGGAMDHVQRLIDGKQIYEKPSLDFTAFIYTPLYYHVCAALTKISGVKLFTLRLVSFLSSLACFVVLFLFVRRETKSLLAGLLSVGMFAAAYEVGGAWLDIGRTDTLFLLFVLLGVYFLRGSERAPGLILAAAMFILAFFTKQTALMIALPLCIYSLLYKKGWLRLVFPVLTAAGIVAGCLYLNRTSDGWFSYYTFFLPRHHEVFWSKVVTFWLLDLAKPCFVSGVLALFLLYRYATDRRWSDLAFYLCFFAGMVGAAWFSRFHAGGYNNVLLPAYIALAISFGVGAALLAPRLFGRTAEESALTVPTLVVLLLVLTQFATLAYDPTVLIPSDYDTESGDRFIERLAGVEGEVWMPYHGYLPALAGKATHAHQMALVDVMRGDPNGEGSKLMQSIKDDLSTGKFDLILMDEPWMTEHLADSYKLQVSWFEYPEQFRPVTGRPFRPDFVYERTK